jgi:hypothetical protein
VKYTFPGWIVVMTACGGNTSSPVSTRDAAMDVVVPDDGAGMSTALTLDYGATDCTAVEMVAFNGGAVRQNEICDRGRAASVRYATLRACAEEIAPQFSGISRVADDGTFLNPTRHPYRGKPCSRFTTLYPVEQIAHALWCVRNEGRCNEDGSLR